MEQKGLIFGEDCINKNVFHKNKRPINIDEVDIRKIVLSSKHSNGNKGSFKYFTGHINNDNALPIMLCIKLPHMNGYSKYFENMYVNLLVHNKKLLKKYNEIWDKISNLLKQGFDSEPVYNDKYIKTKIKSYNNRAYTNFQYNKMPKDNAYCTCLFIILLDSIFVNSDKEYYPQIFLEECKCAIKKKDNEYN